MRPCRGRTSNQRVLSPWQTRPIAGSASSKDDNAPSYPDYNAPKSYLPPAEGTTDMYAALDAIEKASSEPVQENTVTKPTFKAGAAGGDWKVVAGPARSVEIAVRSRPII